ncbi:MAG: tetratricopeptide repeat protein, partial [Verrucomicrobiota bacterium]
MALGDDALRAGLPSVAERFYLDALSDPNLSQEQVRNVTLSLASAYLGQQKLVEARTVLDTIEPRADDQRGNLRRALVAYYVGDTEALTQHLANIDPAGLPPEDRPWYYLMRGLWERSRGSMDLGGDYLARADAEAVSPAQRTDFETEIFRNQIISGQADEETAEKLAERLEQTQGTRVGFDIARQYAILLNQLGRKSLALNVLQDQLPLFTPTEQDEQTEILLLIALIAGESSPRGQLVLEEILRRPDDPTAAAIALNLISRSELAQTEPDRYQQLLDELIADADHPLRDELLMLRARFYLEQDEADLAAADAQSVIEAYPGSALRANALQVLAYRAWHAEPARYRQAADYLNQLRALLPEGEPRRNAQRLAADAYLLNGDFDTAGDAYAAILEITEDAAMRAALLRRLTTSLILAGRYEEASRNLNGLAETSGINPAGRWQAEWELATAMTRDGYAAEALARVQGLLQAGTIEQIPPTLRLRMMWLEMKLASDLQQSSRVPRLADRLLAELGATPQTALSLEDRELIASNALLLRGRALLRVDSNDEALDTFASLREKFPRSEAAVLSYLEEARAYVDQGIFNEAQLSYRKIADDFPASEQAVIALYEGALAAEAQGQERNLREAI